MGKTFYDIHCHVMNLSHPSLVAFVRRLNLDSLLALNSLFAPITGILTKINMKKVMNMLSVMENDLAEFLLIMENDILSLSDGRGGTLSFGGNDYDSYVITPLMLDFGQKGAESYPGIHYRVAPHKPIADQCIDLFNGIAGYLERSRPKCLEVYPFLGINTWNYGMESTEEHVGLADLLDKHFGGFTRADGGDRRKKLREKMGTFDGNIEHLSGHAFAGVKVYPPLGFDPWPEEPAEREKVMHLYEYCAARRIPVATHCGGRGFRTLSCKDPDLLTDPARWRGVLRAYPDLVLNLAHFGGKLKTVFIHDWMKEIARLAAEYENVYTDISCLCFDDGDYADLEKIVKKLSGGSGEAARKILFGSDFMINLLWTDSYRSYIGNFMGTGFLSEHRDSFCSANPERFLWG